MNFIDNKYSRLYFSIIDHAKEHPTEIFEKHHIIPKSLGGSDDSSNLVKLSFRQHFICHKLLTKMVHSKNDKRKMTFALHMMSLNSSRLSRTSKSYEYTRKLRRELGVSEETKEKMRQSMIGKNVGKTASPETRMKMSIAAKFREETSSTTREKISVRLKQEWAEGTRKVSATFKQTGNSMLGKSHSEETKLKQSIAAKNDPRRKLPRGPLSEETKRKIAEKARDRWSKKRETMKLAELHEGMMKRSDPYISGEKSGPRPPAQPTRPTQPTQAKKPATAKPASGAKSSHDQKIDALSKKSKLPPEQVQKAWDEERDKVDSKNPQRWAIVMNNVKKRLHVS